MHNIVIPLSSCLGKFNNGLELKYALRSLQKNLTGDFSVTIVGSKLPGWLKDTNHIKQNKGGLKTALLMAAEAFPEGFQWWYDDLVLLQQQTTEQIKSSPIWKSPTKPNSDWMNMLIEVRDRLVTEGYTAFDFSGPHGPYWFDKNMIDEAMRDWPGMAGKFPVETWILNKFGAPYTEANVSATYSGKFSEPSVDKVFMNWSDGGMTPELISYLDTHFPDKSFFEKEQIEKTPVRKENAAEVRTIKGHIIAADNRPSMEWALQQELLDFDIECEVHAMDVSRAAGLQVMDAEFLRKNGRAPTLRELEINFCLKELLESGVAPVSEKYTEWFFVLRYDAVIENISKDSINEVLSYATNNGYDFVFLSGSKTNSNYAGPILITNARDEDTSTSGLLINRKAAKELVALTMSDTLGRQIATCPRIKAGLLWGHHKVSNRALGLELEAERLLEKVLEAQPDVSLPVEKTTDLLCDSRADDTNETHYDTNRVLFTCHEGCDSRIWEWCGPGIRAFAQHRKAKLVELPKCKDLNPQWVLFDAFKASLDYPEDADFVWIDSDIVVAYPATDVWSEYDRKFRVCVHRGKFANNFDKRMNVPASAMNPCTGIVKWTRKDAEILWSWYENNKHRFERRDGDQELLCIAMVELNFKAEYFHNKMHVAGANPPENTAFKHKGGKQKIYWIPIFLNTNLGRRLQPPSPLAVDLSSTPMAVDHDINAHIIELLDKPMWGSKCNKEMSALGIHCETYNGFDGDGEMEVPMPVDCAAFAKTHGGYDPIPGQIGCYASFYNLFANPDSVSAVSAEHDDWRLTLEDDAVAENFDKHTVIKIIKMAEDEDYDVVILHSGNGNVSISTDEVLRLVKVSSGSCGTQGVLWNKRIKSITAGWTMTKPIDDQLSQCTDLKVANVLGGPRIRQIHFRDSPFSISMDHRMYGKKRSHKKGILADCCNINQLNSIKGVGRGLGNRMTAFLHAYTTAKLRGVKCTMLWVKHKGCDAEWLDLFQPLDGVDIISGREGDYDTITEPAWYSDEYKPEAGEEFWQCWREAAQEIKLASGLHLPDVEPFDAISVRSLDHRSHDIVGEIKSLPSILKPFVAADCVEGLQKVTSALPDAWFIDHQRSVKDNQPRSLELAQAAAVDMMMLTRAKTITAIGRDSTFRNLAHLGYGVPVFHHYRGLKP